MEERQILLHTVELWHSCGGMVLHGEADGKERVMDEYSVGEYIIYRNGEKYELGRIKSLREDGAFVAYHEGETGALTPYSHMHKLINRYCIKDTSLGGDYFKADTPQTDRMTEEEFDTMLAKVLVGQTDCGWK